MASAESIHPASAPTADEKRWDWKNDNTVVNAVDLGLILLLLSAVHFAAKTGPSAGEVLAETNRQRNLQTQEYQSRFDQYVVQAGDNLSLIADRFGLTVEELVSINSLADPNLIYAGQALFIPKPAATIP